MIKIVVVRNNDEVKKINFYGHANYSSFGNDIVCSAASSILTTSVNAILTFGKDYISYEEKKDNFEIVVNENNDIVDKLLKNMLAMLDELARSYPKNVKIKEEEA